MHGHTHHHHQFLSNFFKTSSTHSNGLGHGKNNIQPRAVGGRRSYQQPSSRNFHKINADPYLNRTDRLVNPKGYPKPFSFYFTINQVNNNIQFQIQIRYCSGKRDWKINLSRSLGKAWNNMAFSMCNCSFRTNDFLMLLTGYQAFFNTVTFRLWTTI